MRNLASEVEDHVTNSPSSHPPFTTPARVPSNCKRTIRRRFVVTRSNTRCLCPLHATRAISLLVSSMHRPPPINHYLASQARRLAHPACRSLQASTSPCATIPPRHAQDVPGHPALRVSVCSGMVLGGALFLGGVIRAVTPPPAALFPVLCTRAAWYMLSTLSVLLLHALMDANTLV
ncbi:hypothetical protein C8J57DRAFT_1531236 [Mycena rebaudengoi]|nr:hypothetical protein C8J57DRAFT_1531236 [Mycena rebaudengoi]